MNLKLTYAAPSRGARWVRQGFAVFFKRPLACSALLAGFLFCLLVLVLIPYVGPLLMLAVLPLGTGGFMIATQIILNGKLPVATVFAAPLLKDKFRRIEQIKLGVAYAVLATIIMLLADVLDGGRFEAMEDAVSQGEGNSDAVAESLGDPMLLFGMLVRLGLTALLSIPFWHAPALIHWGSQGMAQALFSSTVAVWRNRGAFTVYGLAWGGVVLAFGIIARIVFELLGRPELAGVAALPAGLIFSTAFYTSLYFTFADCFAPTGKPAGEDGSGGGSGVSPALPGPDAAPPPAASVLPLSDGGEARPSAQEPDVTGEPKAPPSAAPAPASPPPPAPSN